MRNLKKVLALALAFAMVFSVMSGAFVYLDQEEITADGPTRAAVDILNQLKVMVGTAGTSPTNPELRGYNFDPMANLRRNEASSVMTALMNGGITGAAVVKSLYTGIPSQFADVNSDPYKDWYIGFVNYCSTNGIINGKTPTKFDPNGTLTTAEATAMLLILLGYNKADVAKNWPNSVISIGLSLGLFTNVNAEITKPITREAYAVLIVNALKATPVLKNANGVYEKQNVTMLDMGDGYFSPFIDEYDQLGFKLFNVTLDYFTDKRGVLTSSSAYSFKGAKTAAGQVRVDILAAQNNPYLQNNIAYTLTGQSAYDVNLVGAMVRASFYGMITYTTVADLMGGSGHYVTGTLTASAGMIVLVKDYEANYNPDLNATFVANWTNIWGKSIDTTAVMPKNLLTSATAGTYVMALVDLFEGANTKTKMGMTNQSVNDNNIATGIYAIKNGAALTVITDRAGLLAVLEPGSDRPFDTVNKLVTNKDGNIVFADVTEYTIAKATVVGTAGKVINEDVAAAGTLTDINFSTYTWVVAADKPADGTYDNLYIAYNAADKKIVKLAATRVVASSAALADGVVTVKDQNGNVISNYDPYVPTSAKIASGSAVLADYTALIAVNATYDIVRGPAGKVLAAYPVASTIANMGKTYGAIVSVAGAGTLLNPYTVMVLTAAGTTATYNLNTAVYGSNGATAAAYVTGFIGNPKVFIPVSYVAASGKIDLVVINNADFAYSTISGVDTGDDFAYANATKTIVGDVTYALDPNATVFAFDAVTGAFSAVKASTLTADKAVGNLSNDDVVVYDVAGTTGTARVWFAVAGIIPD